MQVCHFSLRIFAKSATFGPMINKIQQRILFGLKVKQSRQAQSLSFADLAGRTGISVSYLNEIEKGKKYPKEDKIQALAHALGVQESDLLSQEFGEGLAPVGELLRSNFLNELPLDLFGIEMSKVVEIIASAGARVGAFISTLLELSRNYAVKEENFYFGALRSYLELHNNYFDDLEQEVDRFIRQVQLPVERPLPPDLLKRLLEERWGYTILDNGLDAYPDLAPLRSVFVPKRKELLLNSKLSAIQRSFQFGKELAFQWLQLRDRAYTSSLLRGRTFEEVLNHSRAIYFSVALHLPQKQLLEEMEAFFRNDRWDGEAFLLIMKRYDATPEMFFHRLTNLLPRFFGMKKLFFLRFVHDPEKDIFEMDKELHLNQKHHPHGNRLNEHYCRRWISLSLLRELRALQQGGVFADRIVKAQISHYLHTEDAYLCLTIARPSYPAPNKNVSVTIGLQLTDGLQSKIRFLDDPGILRREVHTTCERCPLSDCAERACPPVIVEKKQQMHRILEKLKELEG